MTSEERFWNAKWDEYRAAHPEVVERPSWLKLGITPRVHEANVARCKLDAWHERFFAL